MAALIRYCKQIGIPLPRKAQKIPQAQDDGTLALIMRMDWKKTLKGVRLKS